MESEDHGHVGAKTGQDTFLELQEQLAKQNAPGPTTDNQAAADATKKQLDGILASMAKHEGFEVAAILGIGGMGAVVRAMDSKLKRDVALKFLPPETTRDPKKVAELRGEAEIASRIKHENVVSILSWHEVDGIPFYAMELVEGESLNDLVRRRGRLPTAEALRIIAESARGVEALHQVGIIHRDIKPQNILISRDGRVKITDFGISRTQDSISMESLHGNKIAGTPQFMAPEQARGEAATKHSDIYSLGATLYLMLTGRPPVRNAATVKEQIKLVREGQVVPIVGLLPKLNKNVAALVMKSLNANPSRRAFDVASFRQELEQAFIANNETEDPVAARYRRMRTILPVIFVILGLSFGFVTGRAVYRNTTGPARPEESSGQGVPEAAPPAVAQPAGVILTPQMLAEFVARDLDNLRIVASLEGPASTPATLVAQWDEANAAGNVETMVPLVSKIVAQAHLWESLKTAELHARDPRLAIRDQAATAVEVMTMNADVPAEWQKMWYQFLKNPAAAAPRPAGATLNPTAAPAGK